jgi:hypothetical protein
MSLPDGIFDIHVHSNPDITPRLLDDGEIATTYKDVGAAGVVLKNHYESTVGRAAAVSTPELPVYGGLVLNAHAGGFNPAAVAAALAMGARVIWMPTQDSVSQRCEKLPSLGDHFPVLPIPAFGLPPVVDDPQAVDRVRIILRLIAEHDAVLATGHLSAAECMWLLDESRAARVRRTIVTHAGWVVPNATPEQAKEFVSQGAVLEMTAFQLLGSHPIPGAQLADFASRVGMEHFVLSSDAGQPDLPPPPAALHSVIIELCRHGISESQIARSAATLPRDLVEP